MLPDTGATTGKSAGRISRSFSPTQGKKTGSMKPADIDHFYVDSDHHDARTRIDDIRFWVDQAGRYRGPILELAVGTGRIAIPLAEAGFAVTGIDMSDSMLNRAKQKCADASVSVGLIKQTSATFTSTNGIRSS